VEGPCEHGNEHLSCIKCREVVEQLLQEGSAPCSWLLSTRDRNESPVLSAQTDWLQGL
jgi:hypothetical protein